MSQLAHCACASTAVLRSRGHNLCAKKGIGCTNAHHARKRIAGCSTIIAKANMLIWTPRQNELSAEKAADKQEAVMCGMKDGCKSGSSRPAQNARLNFRRTLLGFARTQKRTDERSVGQD